MHAEEKDGAEEVKRMLRAEMTRRGVSYAELVAQLHAVGITETEVNLRNKISRGGFTAAFFVQCLKSMGVQTLRLED
jgi:hypothetical protein